MYNSYLNPQHVFNMAERNETHQYGFFQRVRSQPVCVSYTGQRENRPLDKFQLTFPLRTNYMYAKVKKSLPEMYALTVCMWLKSNASPGVGTPFSYAVPGQANELVLIEWGNNPMEILINDKVCPETRGGGGGAVRHARCFSSLQHVGCVPVGRKAAFPHQRWEVASYLRHLDHTRRCLGGFPRWSQEGQWGESGPLSSHQTPGPAHLGARAGKHDMIHQGSSHNHILRGSEDLTLLNSVKMRHEMPHELTRCWAHMHVCAQHEYGRASLASSGTLTCWTRLNINIEWEKKCLPLNCAIKKKNSFFSFYPHCMSKRLNNLDF